MISEEYSPGLRLTVLTMIVVALFVAVLSRLYYLQVLTGDSFTSLALANSTDKVTSEAPRGRVLTANGSVLVSNRVALALSIERDRFLNDQGQLRDDELVRATVDRLGELLDMTEEELVDAMGSKRRSPFRPVPIAVDVAPEIVFTVQEHPELFPGVVAERLPVRQYPQGDVAAHLLGYTGEISASQLEQERWDGFQAGDIIGQAGLERVYNDALQGIEGSRTVLVNASRTVVGERSYDPPVRGNDVVLTLDLELQRQVEAILAEGIQTAREEFTYELDSGVEVPVEATGGAAVVLDPNTGAVLALASYPTFDPQGLATGSQEYFDFYFDREGVWGHPGINRAVAGTYPPASVWKVASGLGALRDGLAPDELLTCPTSVEIGGRTFRNWAEEDEGQMNLARALSRSCDTFFYQLAIAQWVDENRQEQNLEVEDLGQVDEIFQEAAQDLGFGQEIGVDIPGEADGLVPDRQWRFDYWQSTKDLSVAQGDSINGSCTLANELLEPGDPDYALYRDLCDTGYIWRGGDAVNMSIGQGDVLVTPLQVAAAYGAIAMRGRLMAPRLGAEIRNPAGELVEVIEPQVHNVIDAPDAWWDVLQQGLEDVVMGADGTGRVPFRGFPLDRIPVAGKTGTGEAGFNEDLGRNSLPYSWFASYAPADDPQYVVVVMIERGGGGSQTAAPIARRIYEAIFDLDPTQIEAGPSDVD